MPNTPHPTQALTCLSVPQPLKLRFCRNSNSAETPPSSHHPSFCNPHPLNTTTQRLNSAIPFPSSTLSFIFSALPTLPTLTPFSEGQYPEIGEQISLRGWRRLSKPRTKISKDLVHEFYSNAVRTEEELASGKDYPYKLSKIREVLRIKHMTLGAETDFKTRQFKDQRLDDPKECKEGANCVFQAQSLDFARKLEVPMGEFKHSEQIQIARPITAKVMTTTRGKIINQPQNQPMEEDKDNYDAENLYANHEQDQEMHYEAAGAGEDNYQYHEKPNFEIKREQEKTIKEIEEMKKFQVNQTLMGAWRTTEEKLEERVHETRNEIIEMRKQIRDWRRNASSREGYCGWAHQQANPNLVEIPPHKIPDFLHNNVANKKDPYFGALKSDIQQGESSQAADQTPHNPPDP
ncbi:hypothetical protein PIB30_062872 [Stylosanthes scabra]|uniref:Uncharacterized protein n=1 Tax=Stylosanthes scabra TaxID=79078 RepID=A0ABU6SLQ7_9FABA|nr:hypothetical protein [Stylosanthes scabra]